MAKQLKKIFASSTDEIKQAFTINSWHVSQSVDAFTGAQAYDIEISGSLEVDGPLDLLNQATTTGQTDFLVLDGNTVKKQSGGANGSSGTSGSSGSSGSSGASGSSELQDNQFRGPKEHRVHQDLQEHQVPQVLQDHQAPRVQVLQVQVVILVMNTLWYLVLLGNLL